MATQHLRLSKTFADLGLREALTQTLDELGYETPTPIQLQTIPLLVAGRDLIGQAQTGTGKTAAFALPILARLDLGHPTLQALVLTPTRELAIQVAEAMHTYATRLGRVRVLPIYGGDSLQRQIGRLRGEVHIVIGTPGRLLDHLRRGSLDLRAVKTVVLDEADEMLRMGFLEEVEEILGQTPESRQTALFSATMPQAVRRIASRYLKDPVTIEIKQKTLTVPTVEQHYLHAIEGQKLDVLTQLLETEAEAGEAALIFTRTKVRAANVAEWLQARGYTAEALHGDLSQAQREDVLRRLRGGRVDLVVATDLAARGLDVARISRVINYDIPHDPEAYVHRLGRTARAGCAGKGILLVTPREGRMLREIERYTGQRLTPAKVPTQADVAARRLALFKARILKTLHEEDLQVYLALVEDLAQESNRDMAEIAAAAARLARGTTPLVVPLEPEREGTPPTEPGMVRLFLDAGRRSGVRPADIVGALANEGGVPGQLIGAVDIYDDFTFVEIPNSYQERVLTGLSGVTIRNRKATLRPATAQDVAPPRARKRGDSGAARRQSLGPSQKKRGLQHGKRVGRAGAPRHAAAKTR